MRSVWVLIIAIAAASLGSRAEAAKSLPSPGRWSGQIAEAPVLPRRGATERRSPSDSGSSDRSGGSERSEREPFKYRLIVQGSSDSLLRQVRQTVPDAFRTIIGGRRVIQAGLFVEREEAEAIAQLFDRLDAETQVLALDRPISQPVSLPISPPLVRVPSARPPSSSPRANQYRLVVQGSSDSLLRQVRQIVPDAFRNTIDGRRVVQAGLFVERSEAEVVQRQLAAIDAPTSIFDIDYGVAQRSSTPVARDGRIVVVVDPGHGGGDPGAVGIGGIHEADIVLDVAQQVASLLEKQGIQAVLTRQDDQEVELEPRVDLADRLNAALFVSIHANAISLSRPDVNGLETYYYESGRALATSIHNSLLDSISMNDRGIRQARFYVLTETSMPAVLVEIGFVTGREDVVRFNSAASRSQIAAAIAQGVLRYLQ
ncbi:MAG: N-acetylmuramoyl-L-alanine amidase [Pegethrix bostrychoides GSE-TBD4-15B]|jgi:N-acetylmuramoyl-L-alanine amidase|uniref:N-acetylmuramoyl-L-alanine amidase n=1 Tax=Pegethrix bostrychoides GSE-TBD4-15B TaxID=2839662 RepID=A0A951U6J7_9CYAN|nr:N-acetylmuramoyl-L-alanine amidase [Pegethrix bostrychoides GSE-TBD4-15B]